MFFCLTCNLSLLQQHLMDLEFYNKLQRLLSPSQNPLSMPIVILERNKFVVVRWKVKIKRFIH